jgi:hypothetical protein
MRVEWILLIEKRKKFMKLPSTTTVNSEVVVKVYPYRKPRKSEKTWTASKYSIFNMGAQSMKTGKQGVYASCDKI